jgi:hypothetical protein
MVFSRGRQFLVLAVAALVTLSAVAVFFIFDEGKDEAVVATIEVESWNLESGSYYPWVWVNLSREVSQSAVFADLRIVFHDATTGAYASGSTFHSVPLIDVDGTWSVNRRLSLQNVDSGDYRADVYANCTVNPFDAGEARANAHVSKNISLPIERPALPRVLGIQIVPLDEEGCWHYTVTIEDPDRDGDCAEVVASNKTGYSIYNGLANNSDELLAWVIEGDMDLACEQFSFSVWVTDKDGPYARATFYSQ